MKSKTSRWPLSAAKAQFGELVRRALTEGPRYITKRGKDAVVVVSVETFARLKHKKKKGSLAQFFAESPLVGSGIVLERIPEFFRKIEL